MSDSEIIIPPEYGKPLNERNRILRAYHQLPRQKQRLQALSHQIPVPSPDTLPPAPIKRLADGTPPAELTAVITSLEQQQEEIKNLYDQLGRRRRPASRQGLSARATLILITIVGVLILVALILLFHH